MVKNTIILFYGLFSEEQDYEYIPFGPLFLYSLLKNEGFNPILIHEYKNKDYEEIIKKHAEDAIALGISAMTGRQIKSGIKAVKYFRKYAGSEIPIIWGGAHATAMPINTLQSEYVNYVYVGPVTQNILNFFKLIKFNDKSKLTNLSKIITSETYERFFNLDLSKFPPLLINDFDFSYLITQNRVLNYTASIGCPGQCTFCSWGGKRHPWTEFPIERVLDDVEYLVDKYKLKTLWFSDSDFSLKKNYILSIAKGLIERDIDIYWKCNARVVELLRYHKKDYSLLEKSGMDSFFLGIENIDPQIQKIFNKTIKTEWILKVVKETKDFEILHMMSFIVGTPNGPLDDLEKNKNLLNKCMSINKKIHFQTCFYTPYPGTPLTKAAKKLGYDEPKTLEEFGEHPFFVNTKRAYISLPWLSKDKENDYINRFNKLFAKTEVHHDWNWREK